MTTADPGTFEKLRALAFAESDLREVALATAAHHPGLESARRLLARGDLGEAREALERIPPEDRTGSRFGFTRACLEARAGDAEAAKSWLRRIVDEPDPRTHDVLQAWKLLRDLDEMPPAAAADQVLAVVVEVVTDRAMTTVMVGFADGQLRWLRPDRQLIGESWTEPERRIARRLVALGGECLAGSSPADRKPPAPGGIHFHFLTPGGVRRLASAFDRLERAPPALRELFGIASEINEIGLSIVGMATHALPAREQLRALLGAIRRGDPDRVRHFLGFGADADAQDESGATALMTASYLGHPEIVQNLIASGASVEARDRDGATALMFAAKGGRADCVAALLEGGADAGARDHDGNATIAFAAQHGHREVVQRLLAAGSDPTVGGTQGLTAIDLALQNGHTEVAELLGGTKRRRRSWWRRKPRD